MTGRRRRVLTALGAMTISAAGASDAQRPAPRPAGQQRPKPSTEVVQSRDTSQKPLVEWAEPDSVMAALLERQGYVVTRYQSDEAIFRAPARELRLLGHAAVHRDPSTLVSDTIIYQDSAKRVIAFGYPSTLRDPSQQQADLVALGRLEYDLVARRALATNVSTAVEAGETWFVRGERTAPQLADSARGQEAAFYARIGEITSCDLPDTLRHYHFRSREIKLVNRKSLVARPAVLYIADIPVMWLPFIFKSLTPGRQSGLLTPRLGVSEIVRNSPTYRRHVEDLGYYWAISDYMDATVAIDWRSGSRPTPGDPGWTRTTAQWQYRWLDRFMTGRISGSHLSQRDGSRTTAVSWQHQQDFSIRRSINANLNYTTNTTVRRETELNPIAAVAVIGSQLAYRHEFSRLSMNVGGSRKQYPGRSQVDQDFPNFSLTTKGPINVGEHIVWTPTFGFQNRQALKIDQGGGITFRYLEQPGGILDSARIERNSRSTSAQLGTPLQIFGFRWDNSFSITDILNDFPETRTIYGPDSGQKQTRTFARTYATKIDWRTGFALPTLFQGTWNLGPSISIENVDPSGYWVRTEQSGDEFVRGTKRLTYNVGVSPTFYGLFRGFGPVSRFRHSISPSLSYSFAPAKRVSDEYLEAINRDPFTYLGALRQNQLTLGFSTNLEAKLRQATDTAPDAGRKIKVLSMNFDALSYDFERERKTGRGFTTNRFGYSARSDLLPGVDLRVQYSLFQGDPLSDTAKFDPYRENVSASFSVNRNNNPFVLLTRIFGKVIPWTNPSQERIEPLPSDEEAEQLAPTQPTAAGGRRNAQLVIPTGRGWQANFTYSLSRPRPPVGENVIDFDPRTSCDVFLNEFQRLACLQNVQATGEPTLGFQTSYGSPLYRRPPQQTLQSSVSFNVTPKWAAQWATTYDFEEAQFASHSVTLQRELHDWRAMFTFVQAPNGNFAFSFFISLKAEPSLKFDYDKQSYRRGGR